MKLTPRNPPGRPNRRARGFADEIFRLRGEGYSLEAIQQALADVGVNVSRSTVYREGIRLKRVHPSPARNVPAASLPASGPDPPVSLPPPPRSLAGNARSAKNFAEAFMASQMLNPLLRSRS